MRATMLAVGLAAGLSGTATDAQAQWGYPGYPGYYGGFSPYYAPTYARGAFYGGRYQAVPVYGYGLPGYGYGGFGAYNSGFGFPAYGYGAPGFGSYGSGFRFNYSYGGFGY